MEFLVFCLSFLISFCICQMTKLARFENEFKKLEDKLDSLENDCRFAVDKCQGLDYGLDMLGKHIQELEERATTQSPLQ